ncbi:lanthionine synthetase LanC family protein [Thermoflavimicrobium daqui]|uniref:lanthionine synthetase LanC family protein n=1 Tax=Thermoflavimicrobium daqui TaxID=2137476 RepID=UPI0023E8BDF2|nr:lanthionine synthetase LanC family protein [Thermoflavimicrobium daqui]
MFLFLAWLAKVSGEEKYEVLSRGAVEQIKILLKEDLIKGTMNIGAYDGLSGVVYVLSNLAKIWKDDSLLSWIDLILIQIEKVITKDEYLDLIGGSAGCILVMLGHNQISKNKKALSISQIYK